MKNITTSELRTRMQPLIEFVCEYTGTRPDLIFVKSRRPDIIMARQLVIYWLKRNTKLRYHHFEKIYNQTHGNLISGQKRINNLIDTEKELRQYIEDNEQVATDIINLSFYDRTTWEHQYNKLIESLEINAFHGCYSDNI